MPISDSIEALLDIRNLSVRYGAVVAVDDVSLQVPPSGIITIIGPNGAGKSSLLRAIAGLESSQGSIRYAGQEISRLATSERLRLGLALVPESRELFTSMSVRDNLLLGAYTAPAGTRRQLDITYALFPRLKERERQLAGTLSGGERQMLAGERALMARPRMLLLDEPSLGLAPLITREIFRVLKEEFNDMSVVLIEQNAALALDTASYGHVMELGRFQLSGTSAALVENPRLAESYLGH